MSASGASQPITHQSHLFTGGGGREPPYPPGGNCAHQEADGGLVFVWQTSLGCLPAPSPGGTGPCPSPRGHWGVHLGLWGAREGDWAWHMGRTPWGEALSCRVKGAGGWCLGHEESRRAPSGCCLNARCVPGPRGAGRSSTEQGQGGGHSRRSVSENLAVGTVPTGEVRGCRGGTAGREGSGGGGVSAEA